MAVNIFLSARLYEKQVIRIDPIMNNLQPSQSDRFHQLFGCNNYGGACGSRYYSAPQLRLDRFFIDIWTNANN